MKASKPKQLAVYKSAGTDGSASADDEQAAFDFVFWKPSFRRFVPPGKSRKYVIYWIFHYLRIFRNRDYAALLRYDGDTCVSSLLIVPAYYKWPFMKPDDLQMTYVITHRDYRRRGLSEKLLRHAFRETCRPERTLWYITDRDNKASRNLCTKVGFGLHAYATNRGILKRVIMDLSC